MKHLGQQLTGQDIATVVSAFPSKTVAELGSTYLAANHFPSLAFCLDSSPPAPVFSYTGQWLMLGTFQVVSTDPAPTADTIARRGINLSGMENADSIIPGVAGTNYFIPTLANFQYWAGKGMNIVRLPILLARWFDTPGGALNATGKAHLDTVQGYADATGMKIVLDGHDYAKRCINGAVAQLGSAVYPISAWASDWAAVAVYTKGKSAFWGIDFVNEPNGLAITSNEFNYIARPYKQLMRDPQLRNPDVTANWYITDPYSLTSSGGTTGGGRLAWNSASGVYKDAIRHWNSGNDTGYDVKESTTYVMSFYMTQTSTGGTHALYINAGANSGGAGAVQLASLVMADASTRTRVSVQFTTGAGQTKLYWNLNMQGYVGSGYAEDWNLNEGVLQAFAPWSSDGGPVATNTTMQNIAIAAVRSAGFTGWLLWEPDRAAGLASFGDNYGFFPDVPWIDPLNRTQLSLHYYQDQNYSGTYTGTDNNNGLWAPVLRTRLPTQMKVVGDWATAKGVKVFLGEYGVPSDASASSANLRADLDSMLTLADQYSFNGAYWAAGDGFSSVTTIGPVGGVDNATVLPIVMAHGYAQVGNATPTNAVTYNGSTVKSNGQTVTYS